MYSDLSGSHLAARIALIRESFNASPGAQQLKNIGIESAGSNIIEADIAMVYSVPTVSPNEHVYRF